MHEVGQKDLLDSFARLLGAWFGASVLGATFLCLYPVRRLFPAFIVEFNLSKRLIYFHLVRDYCGFDVYVVGLGRLFGYPQPRFR